MVMKGDKRILDEIFFKDVRSKSVRIKEVVSHQEDENAY